MPGERRGIVVIGTGTSIGIGLVTFLVSTCVRFLPFTTAVALTYAITVAITIFAVWKWRTSPALKWDLSKPLLGLVVTMLGIVLLVTILGYVSSVWYANSHENLLIQLALTEHVTAGNWPPVHPWEPDTLQVYRFGGQLWAASISTSTGASVFTVGLAVTVIAVLALLLGLIAALTLLSNKTTGLVGAMLFAVAGPQNFLALTKSPFGEFTPSTAHALTIHRSRLLQGYIHASSFEQLVSFSFTTLVGLSAAAGVGAIALAIAQGRARILPSLVIGSAALAGMSVTSEHLLPVMAGMLFLGSLALSIAKQPKPAISLAGLVGFGSILAVVPYGPLATLLTPTPSSPRSFLRLGLDQLFTLPTRESLSPGSQSLFFLTDPVPRVSLIDPLMWKQFGWVLVAIAGSGIIAICRRRPRLAIPGTGALLALLIPGILHDDLNPHNTARFTTVGILLASTALAIVIVNLWRWRPATMHIGRPIAVCLTGLASGTWLVTLGLLPSLVYQTESPVLDQELSAASFTSTLPYPQRALLLPGPRTFAELNSSLYDGMHKYAVTFGRLQVPMGFDNLGNRDRYAALYAQAQDTLQADDLAALSINLLYVAPNLLTAPQKDLIQTALAKGTIQPIFQSSGGARMLYQVTPHAAT